jgi:hypothetical protein
MSDDKKVIEFDRVLDSGERQAFETGSKRDTRSGKGRYDLISPIFMARLARHMENGAVKYGDRNWELGQPLMRYYDSASRHLWRFLAGDTDEDHLTAAAWNIHCMIHTEQLIATGVYPKELDDRPKPVTMAAQNDKTKTT